MTPARGVKADIGQLALSLSTPCDPDVRNGILQPSTHGRGAEKAVIGHKSQQGRLSVICEGLLAIEKQTSWLCPLRAKSSLYRFQVTDSVNSRRSSLGWRIAGLEVHPDAPERSVDLQHVSFSSMEAVVLCAAAHVKIVNMQDVRRKAGRGC